MNSVDFGRWKLVISRSAERDARAGRNEDIGVADERLANMAVGVDRRSISRKVVPTAITRRLVLARRLIARRLRGNLAPSGMHPVILHVFGFHRQEGARPDMERQGNLPDATRIQRLEGVRA